MPTEDIYRARRAALIRKLAVIKAQINICIRKIDIITRELSSEKLIKRIEKQVNNSRVMQAIMHERFVYKRTHGKAGGMKWKDRKTNRPNQLLVDSGELREEAKDVVRNTFKLTEPIEWESLVGQINLVYAEKQNDERPFMENPTDEELEPAYRIADMYLEQELKRILE
jgi:hypothetical protein